MSNLSLSDQPSSHPGVAGPTEGLPGPGDPPFVPVTPADGQHQDVVDPALQADVGMGFATLEVHREPFLEEADALADALLEAVPVIREAMFRLGVRSRPTAALDVVNEALMRYLRARRAR